MFRVTSLTAMSDRQLDRWIKRVAVLALIALVAFVGFYVVDRYRDPGPTMVDRNILALEETVRADPADLVSRGQLADLYASADRYEEALTQYSAIIDSGQDLELAHFGRAKAYLELGELDAAAADYQVVVDIAKDGEMAHIDPMLNAAYFGLGSIALEQGRFDDAATHLEAATRIKRADADAWYLLGTALVGADRPAEAVEALQQAVAFVPFGWAEPYVAMAQAFGDLGQADRAEWANAMADLSAGKPDEAQARLLTITEGEVALDAAIGLGLVSESLGDTASAADWYAKALAIDPENVAALLGMGRVTEAPLATPLPELPEPGEVEGGEG
ncbi:MAG TPA: tetratricopeptide repeat protein [Candidatus Limnocylindrales bacterium]|nr:tetratricopeptide repeat protein [Candidatus Limnocylindrales bacterium]